MVKNNTARDFKRIVHMEPTPVEMQSFTTVESVFVWAQLKGEPLQKLLYILGVEDDDHPRVLAAVSVADWDGAISKWSALAKPASPAQKAKTVVASGAAALTTSAARAISSVVCSLIAHGADSVRMVSGSLHGLGIGGLCHA